MDIGESPSHELSDVQGEPPVQCDACEAALHSNGKQSLSFLLLDTLTIPLLGCEDHLGQFRHICGYTTEEPVDLLNHHPAGGIACPSCHLAPHNPLFPILPVQDGAVAVLACPEHQAELLTRYQTGRDTQFKLSTSLDTD